MSREITEEVIVDLKVLYEQHLPEESQRAFAARAEKFQAALVDLAMEQQARREAILSLEEGLERGRGRLGELESTLTEVRRLRLPEPDAYLKTPTADNITRLRFKIRRAQKEGKLRGWRRLLSPLASRVYPQLDALEGERERVSQQEANVQQQVKTRREEIDEAHRQPLQNVEQKVHSSEKVLLGFADQQAVADSEIRQQYLAFLPGRLDTVASLYVRQNAASAKELDGFWDFMGDQSVNVSVLARRHPWLNERTVPTPEQYLALPDSLKRGWESYLRGAYRVLWLS